MDVDDPMDVADHQGPDVVHDDGAEVMWIRNPNRSQPQTQKWSPPEVYIQRLLCGRKSSLI